MKRPRGGWSGSGAKSPESGRSMAAASAAAATPAASVEALPLAAPAAVAAAVARARVPGPDLTELVRGLALDRRIAREPQADAASLPVHLDHRHVELVALLEHVLHRAHALTRLDVGDVEESVRALGQLDERSERGRLDDLARESVPHLGLLGHRLDPRDAGVHQGAVRRIHLDGAVVLDVDVRLELLRERPDRLPALADQRADLLGVD